MPDSDPQPSINKWRRQADQFRGQPVLEDQPVRRLNACISEFLGLRQDVAKLHEADYLKTFHMLKILNARFRLADLLMCCLLGYQRRVRRAPCPRIADRSKASGPSKHPQKSCQPHCIGIPSIRSCCLRRPCPNHSRGEWRRFALY